MASLAQTIRVSGKASRGTLKPKTVKLRKAGPGVALAGLNARNQIVITQAMVNADTSGSLTSRDLGRVVNYRLGRGGTGSYKNTRIHDNAGDLRRTLMHRRHSNVDGSTGLASGAAGTHSRSRKPSARQLINVQRRDAL